MARPSSAALVLLIALHTQAFAQGNGSNHSQNITTNNGVSVQLNVQQNLQKAATTSMLDERGWMRVLTPGHDPTPRGCDLPNQVGALEPGDFKIYYGTNVAACSYDHCNIVIASTGKQHIPLISVQRIRTGVVLTALVYDKDGNIAAKIVDDKPYVNRNYVSDFNRPDEHSVWVKDNKDREVLNVRLLNPNSLRIEGVFNVPYDESQSTTNRPYMTITKDAVTYEPGGRIDSENCFSMPRQAFGAISFGYPPHQ